MTNVPLLAVVSSRSRNPLSIIMTELVKRGMDVIAYHATKKAKVDDDDDDHKPKLYGHEGKPCYVTKEAFKAMAIGNGIYSTIKNDRKVGAQGSFALAPADGEVMVPFSKYEINDLLERVGTDWRTTSAIKNKLATAAATFVDEAHGNANVLVEITFCGGKKCN